MLHRPVETATQSRRYDRGREKPELGCVHLEHVPTPKVGEEVIHG